MNCAPSAGEPLTRRCSSTPSPDDTVQPASDERIRKLASAIAGSSKPPLVRSSCPAGQESPSGVLTDAVGGEPFGEQPVNDNARKNNDVVITPDWVALLGGDI